MLLVMVVFVFSFSQAQAVLVGHWKFDGNADDTTTYNNDGTIVADAKLGPNGIYGSALYPNTGYVTVADASSLDITGSFTIEAWVKPSTLTGYNTIVFKDAHVYGYNMSLYNGKVFAEIGLWVYPTEKVTYTSSASVTPGVWSHIVLTYDQSKIKCYINGVKDTTEVSETRAVRPNSTDLTIGAWGPTGNREMSGPMDEVRIYNHALTATEVKDNYDDVVVDVTDFGATGLGMVDDAPAIRSAISSISSTGGIIKIPVGTYLINSLAGSATQFRNAEYAFILSDNMHMVGVGEGDAVLYFGQNMHLKTTAGAGAGLILANEKENVGVHNLKIDMNGSDNLMPESYLYMVGYVINFWLCDDVIVDDNRIFDSYGRNTILLGGRTTVGLFGNNGIVTDNLIVNGGTSIIGNDYQDDYSAIYVDYTNSVITGNRITHSRYPFRNSGGIEIHNDNTVCNNNQLEYCHPGVYIGADFAGDYLDNIDVSDNTFIKCNRGIYFFGVGDFDDITISRNDINLYLNPNMIVPVASGILLPRDDNGIFDYSLKVNHCLIDGNAFTEDFYTTPDHATAHGIVLSSVFNTDITNNTFDNMTGSAVVLRGCPYGMDNVVVEYNVITDFGINTSLYEHNALGLDILGSSTIPLKSAYDAQNIFIKNNSISLSAGTGLTCYAFYFNWSDLSAVTNIVVSGNVLDNVEIKRGNKAYLVTVIP
jgi:hypothetical protein